MKKEGIHSNEPNIDHNRAEPVACVAGVADTQPPTWPPAWLAALNPPEDAPRQVNFAALNLHGWRLPNGVVVPRYCCGKPTDAVPVMLVVSDDGPQWVEEPAPTPSLATTSPEAAPIPQHPSNDPQWL